MPRETSFLPIGRRQWTILATSIIMLTTSILQAGESEWFPPVYGECYPSSMTPPSFPMPEASDHINHTNNLTRPAGIYHHARGQVIDLRGLVLDANCVPIEGANVTLWQQDAGGYPPIDTTPSSSDDTAVAAGPAPDPAFQRHGIAHSNNRGVFTFRTILPPSQDSIPPHVNIRITDGANAPFESRISIHTMESPSLRTDMEISIENRPSLRFIPEPGHPERYVITVIMPYPTPYVHYRARLETAPPAP